MPYKFVVGADGVAYAVLAVWAEGVAYATLAVDVREEEYDVLLQ